MSKKIFEAEEQPAVQETPVQGQTTPTDVKPEGEAKPEAGSDEETLKRLTELMSKDYTTFVQELSKLTSDNNIFPKLKNLILGGEKDGNPSDEKFSISEEYDQVVTALIPTQNEIDRNKSLPYSVTYPAMSKDPEAGKKQIVEMLTGAPIRINNMPIVVFDYEGKTYILDGHHRWSSVYSLNSNGKIKAIKLTSSKGITPLNALRAVQLSIAVAINKVPINTAGTEDTNLLLPSSNPYTKKYLEDNASDEFVGICKEVLKMSDKQAVVDYIMKNIGVMQSNGFLKGAPSRVVMPQTDGTPELEKDQELWKAPLTQGDINVLPNFKTESKKWVKTYEQFRRR